MHPPLIRYLNKHSFHRDPSSLLNKFSGSHSIWHLSARAKKVCVNTQNWIYQHPSECILGQHTAVLWWALILERNWLFESFGMFSLTKGFLSFLGCLQRGFSRGDKAQELDWSYYGVPKGTFAHTKNKNTQKYPFVCARKTSRVYALQCPVHVNCLETLQGYNKSDKWFKGCFDLVKYENFTVLFFKLAFKVLYGTVYILP